MKPGDNWTYYEDVEHGAMIIKDAVAIEIFSPVGMIPEGIIKKILFHIY
ncbi:MAG: hypothetical protein A4E27_00134 [Methanobacterium sp. PtaU1.Bin242]|nr:MAG: hypothetical protein A4E27_00134 [Methanobacterium sp. PtaU1.Bin242]